MSTSTACVPSPAAAPALTSEPEFTSGERGGLGGACATGGGAGYRAAPPVDCGREAALALDPWFVPVDHTIVGIVDTFHREEVSR